MLKNAASESVRRESLTFVKSIGEEYSSSPSVSRLTSLRLLFLAFFLEA